MQPRKTAKRTLSNIQHGKREDDGYGLSKAISDDAGEVISKLPRNPKKRNRLVPIIPESKDDRAKRLAARKARTLKAFQTTFENRNGKAS